MDFINIDDNKILTAPINNIGLMSINDNGIISGPANSGDFNRIIHNIHTDIGTLATVETTMSEDIASALSIYTYENYYLNKAIIALNDQLVSLHNMVDNIQNGIEIKTLYHSVDELISSNVDYELGRVTLPVGNKVNKLLFKNGSNIYLPDDLGITISQWTDVDTTEENITQSTDFIKGNYWVRVLKYDATSAVTKVYCKVVVDVPIKTMNNIYSNVIKVITSPYKGVNVESISYKNQSGNVIYISDIKQLNIISDTDVIQFEVIISQNNPVIDNTYKNFAIGFKEIGLYYYDFLNTGSFVMPFSLENTSAYFSSLKSIDIIDGVTCRFYTDIGLAKEVWLNSDIIEYTKNIYVQVTLEKNDVIPIIEGAKLSFYVRGIS